MSDTDNDANRASGTDSTAMLGVAFAGVLSLLVAPGPWSPGSMMVGLALAALLLGVWHPPRGWRQAMAWSATLGLTGLLVVGWPLSLVVNFAGTADPEYRIDGTRVIRADVYQETMSEALNDDDATVCRFLMPIGPSSGWPSRTNPQPEAGRAREPSVAFAEPQVCVANADSSEGVGTLGVWAGITALSLFWIRRASHRGDRAPVPVAASRAAQVALGLILILDAARRRPPR